MVCLSLFYAAFVRKRMRSAVILYRVVVVTIDPERIILRAAL